MLAVAIGLFVLLDAPGLDRIGVPQEELAVERTVLKPGEIELHVRNDGADPVQVQQVIVNDALRGVHASRTSEIGRLGGSEIDVEYPWIEGQDYEVMLLTATGATIDHAIEAAAETPDADLGFYGLMALIGLYVGVIPVAIGMLWLPWIRGVDARWIRFLLAFTVGLLAFLGVEALLEGTELAGQRAPRRSAARRWSGSGAAGAFLALAGVDAWLRGRRAGGAAGADGGRRGRAPGWAPATAPRSWSRSASACTTSARGSRSARRTRSARSRSAPRSSSASRSTTPPRGSRSSRRWRGSAGARLRRLALLGLLAGAPGGARRLDRRLGVSTRAWPRSCSASARGRSPR